MIRRIFPSVLTLTNLLLGFLAIVFTLKYDLSAAAGLIGLGMVCDFFDDYSARRLNVVSALDKELASLADLVTFGISPALWFMPLR